jgi:flagella basal body P-ring formation protein FlgA
LRQPVAEGAVILPGQLVQPRAVRRGQRVVIEAVRGAMQVNGSGEALADGMPGERIKVRNVGSGRVVEATVRPDGRVRVEF